MVNLLKLMKMKFSDINILFLDEIFSSVDSDGIYSILSILKDVSKELGLNIFVIKTQDIILIIKQHIIPRKNIHTYQS
jgi:ABC-type Mn2+/Zn2+ transport system ATPase subunit